MDKTYGVKYIITWNNNDTKSWRYNVINQDVHMIGKNGKGKNEYEYYANEYSQRRKQKLTF